MAKAAAVGGTIQRVVPFSTPTHVSFQSGDDAFFAGWADEGGEEAPAEEAPAAPPAEAPAKPFQDVEDDLYKLMVDRVKTRLHKDLAGPEEPHTPTESTNESLNKVAKTYEAGLDALVRTASSDAALVNGVALYNSKVGVEIPVPLYRVALVVGNPVNHGTVDGYRVACQKALGRNPTAGESQVLLRLGRLLYRRGTPGGSSTGSRH